MQLSPALVNKIKDAPGLHMGDDARRRAGECDTYTLCDKAISLYVCAFM